MMTVGAQSKRPTALATGAVAIALLLAACGSDTNPSGTGEPDADEEHVIGHIHGLGVDPADGILYVAGHLGVFKVTDGVPTRIADRWQDTMAFTVTGPHTFLASGHPDLREDLPPHLGLIESTDAAKTWEPVSLQGEADFHALEVIGDRIYGYESTGSRLMTTSNRKDWSTLGTGQLIDLASLPSLPDQVLATTPEGKLVSIGLDGKKHAFSAGPPLVWIDGTPEGTLLGATIDGKVFTTTDPAGEWRPAGTVAGQTGAIDATDRVWHIATDQAIYSSTDGGKTWDVAVEGEH